VLLSDSIEVPAVSFKISRDPDDDLLLACAVQGYADYVVTGDRDLLDLKVVRDIPLITPEAFLRKLTV
jgi:predicted nucleic acid-binding protein